MALASARSLCLLALGAAAAATACDAAPRTLHRRRDPGALVVAQARDVGGLDPARAVDPESLAIDEILFEGLARLRPGTTSVEPGLATGWQVSTDRLRWTFTLRPDVVFHDGAPLDADAVVFSFQRVLDPQHPSYLRSDDAEYWRGLLRNVSHVTAVDPRTVAIDLWRPYAPLLSELALFPIVSPAAVRRWGDDFRRHPVGTGAFAFESWDAEEHLVLRRFPRYWGPRPALDSIVFRVVVDARQRLVDLQSGSVDVASISPDDQSFVELHPDLVLHRAPINDVSFLAFNLDHTPFSDIRVRRAISYAINKQPIVRLAYQDRAIPADSVLPPGQWGHHEPAVRYTYDPDRARGLLAEATAARVFDPDRIFRLYAPLAPPEPMAVLERVARYVQVALAQIGVRVELVVQPVPQFLDSLAKGDHDLALYSWIGDTGDPDNFLFSMLHSESKAHGRAQNISFYRSADVDRLLVDAQTALDLPSRSEIYAKVQDLVASDAPWVVLAHSELVVAARAEIDQVILTPLGHPLYAMIRRKDPR